MRVLILVLVEHTLGVFEISGVVILNDVLILVLVEHTLGVQGMSAERLKNMVLILVLVEHTLGDTGKSWVLKPEGLNPCFSGTYSRRWN